MNDRASKIDEVFQAALDLPPHERTAFVEGACRDDEICMAVKRLLVAHESAEAAEFMKRPVGQVGEHLIGGKGPLTEGHVIGKYRLVEFIGCGGMGEVYLAEDLRLGRHVALKLLPPYLTTDSDRVRRFEREARAASALNHQNILTVHDIGQDNNIHFIATEFIEGETLRQHMMSSPLEVDEALDIAIQAAAGLAAAHKAKIVHRDIKPENIMIRQDDGAVKLLDFGLAKPSRQQFDIARDSEAATAVLDTAPGVVIGTVAYMSPEQARGLAVDERTDIWSLGVVLYEMVAGQLPFGGGSTDEIIAAIQSKNPPRPIAEFVDDVPASVDEIVAKALTKDREKRYQAVKDLQIDLERLRHRSATEAESRRVLGVEQKVSTPPASIGTMLKQRKRAIVALLSTLTAGAALASYVYFAARPEQITSIAVLPFANVGSAPEIEYLSDGISESLINRLSQLPRVKVIARSSSFKYKNKEVDPQEVASTLGVEAVLIGRVSRRGENLLISAELVDARDRTQVWGQQYERKPSDMFVVQEEIAIEISEKLRVKLTVPERQQLAKRPTENLDAFQSYMQGRASAQRGTRQDLHAAVRHYEKAIEGDRNFALAYAGLADAYAILGARGQIAPGEGRRKAEEAARKVLALDDNLAEGHAALGLTYIDFVPYSFARGEQELRRAIELSPSFALAHFYLGLSFVRQGRLDEAEVELRKARELDPLSGIIARILALPSYLRRDYVQALELLRRADELGPAFITGWEIGAYLQYSLDEGLSKLEKAKRERKNDAILIFSNGMIYAAKGKRTEALQIIKDLEAMSGATLSQAHYIAKIYSVLREKELALSWLQRGLDAGAIGLFYKDEPIWDPIRGDSRFSDMLRRMGIPS